MTGASYKPSFNKSRHWLLISFNCDIIILTLLKFFLCHMCKTIYFWLQNKPQFKISRDDFIIGPKPFSLERFFEVCKRPVITSGYIWKIRWMVKQFKAQFVYFGHRFQQLMSRSIVLIKDHFFSSFVSFKAPIMPRSIRYWRLFIF